MGKRAKPEENEDVNATGSRERPNAKLREVEVRLSRGETTGQAVRTIGGEARSATNEQTYYRWRKEYGGLQVGQAKRMKDMEKENQRLRKAVSDLMLDKQILEEVIRGKY